MLVLAFGEKVAIVQSERKSREVNWLSSKCCSLRACSYTFIPTDVIFLSAVGLQCSLYKRLLDLTSILTGWLFLLNVKASRPLPWPRLHYFTRTPVRTLCILIDGHADKTSTNTTALCNCQFISFHSSQTFWRCNGSFLLLVDVLDWIFMARHLRCIYT